MTATYDPSLSTPRDRLRFKLGDRIVTPPTAALFSDEELDALLADANDDVDRAAYAAAESLINDLSSLPDSMSVGDTSLSVGQMVERWTANRDRFRREIGGMPFTGGVSRGDVRSRQADTDRVTPFFQRETRNVIADDWGRS